MEKGHKGLGGKTGSGKGLEKEEKQRKGECGWKGGAQAWMGGEN